MKILIVDDEALARNIILEFLAERKENLEVFEASNAKSAKKKIEDNADLDLLFLDVEMPGDSGLDFLSSINFNGSVIFTTAYSEHAVKAFELNAIDYLLKPFSNQRFHEAFEKVLNEKNTEQLKFFEKYLQKEKLEERLLLKDGSRSRFIKLKDIIAFEAFGDYVKVILNEDTWIDHNKISYYESILPNKYFIRIHRSTIVNLEFILEIDHQNDKKRVKMINKNQYDLSKSGYDKLKLTNL